MSEFWYNTMWPLFKVCMIAAAIIVVLGLASAFTVWIWSVLLAAI